LKPPNAFGMPWSPQSSGWQRIGIGHWREELADKSHRFWLVYSYLIVYRDEAELLQIVRVLQAARDVQSALGLSPDEP
jgi:plasmid stabilization system protein ParE